MRLDYKFQKNYEKTSEKHVEKNTCIGSMVHQRCILLMFKVHILFMLVYILFLAFTLNTQFFDSPLPR